MIRSIFKREKKSTVHISIFVLRERRHFVLDFQPDFGSAHVFFIMGLRIGLVLDPIRPMLKHLQEINKSDLVKVVATFFRAKRKKKNAPPLFSNLILETVFATTK